MKILRNGQNILHFAVKRLLQFAPTGVLKHTENCLIQRPDTLPDISLDTPKSALWPRNRTFCAPADSGRRLGKTAPVIGYHIRGYKMAHIVYIIHRYFSFMIYLYLSLSPSEASEKKENSFFGIEKADFYRTPDSLNASAALSG